MEEMGKHNVPSAETLKITSDLRKLFNDHIEKHDEDNKIINDKLDMMMPAYKDISDLGTFIKVGKKIGLSLVLFLTIFGAIYGAIIGIKEWIKY